MNKNNKIKILITNDDGLKSKGIKQLINIANKLGDVYIIAPNKDMSGMSHAITCKKKIYTKKVYKNTWVCSGTPVDCIKIALEHLLTYNKPNICLTGINNKSNDSINVLYSGTLAAAIEASLFNIPSICFSYFKKKNKIKDISITNKYITNIIKYIIKYKLPKHVVLNINIPNIIQGIKICKQATGIWKNNFKICNNNDKKSKNTKIYILSGYFKNKNKSHNADTYALKNNYISIVPITSDLTSYKNIKFLNKCKKKYNEYF